VLGLLLYSSYCLSEEVYETSPNAAAFGLNWVMTNILPQQAGLSVNSVVYRYTAVKEDEWNMLVHVQNEDAEGTGYIFRETDDWSNRPGNTVNKVVPVANIPIQRWGDGSIEVEGQGTVEDATVLYNYQYDTCFNVTTDPNCPGFIPPSEMMAMIPEVIDPLDDEFVQREMNKKAKREKEIEEEEDRKRIKLKKLEEDTRLDQILGIVDQSLVDADAVLRYENLVDLSALPSSYISNIPDTVYEETIVLKDATLPDNNQGRRANFAQQLLHEQMVDLQYD
jgi:hypothetical protein